MSCEIGSVFNKKFLSPLKSSQWKNRKTIEEQKENAKLRERRALETLKQSKGLNIASQSDGKESSSVDRNTSKTQSIVTVLEKTSPIAKAASVSPTQASVSIRSLETSMKMLT